MSRRTSIAAVLVAGLLIVGSACDTTSQTSPSARPHRATKTAHAHRVGVRPHRQPSAPAATPPSRPVASGKRLAAAVLGVLPVKGRSAMTGYDRDEFGAAWLDANRNGCDTRNDILRAQLTSVQLVAGTHRCKVSAGVLADPYTAMRIVYVEGDGTLVDIDHVVALGDAWVTGAARWSMRKRAAFANDPLNLLAVDASANRQKGDADAASWLPPSRGYRCSYVSRQVAVKQKYGLWVTPAEKAAIARVLSSCPGWPLTPDVTHAPVVVSFPVADPSGSGTGIRPLTSKPGGSVYYQNCDAARAAGAAPLHRGDPGYSAHLDRDGDGIACE